MAMRHERGFRLLVVASAAALLAAIGIAHASAESGPGAGAGAEPTAETRAASRPGEAGRSDASGTWGTTTGDETSRQPRILLVGDSITQGMAGDWTWRYRAYQLLAAQGVEPDFVGYRTDTVDPATKERVEDYADPDFDRDHAGVAGMSATDPQFDVAGLTAATRPDVVVVSLGVNDALQGHDPVVVAAALEATVADVRSVAPYADVVLAEQTTTWVDGVPAINALIRQLVGTLDSAESRVVLAPVPDGYDALGDTWDGVHPNAIGELGIAHEVVGALAELGYAEKPAVVTDVPAAGPPRSVVAARVTSATPTSLELTWTLPRGITKVEVQGRDLSTGGGWTPLGLSAWDAREHTLTGLAPGHSYELRLRPSRGTALSDESYTTTLTATTPLG
ncbi:MAG TPA: GDSL-type esterase/lipase family protein [Nocardioides sp.]